MKYIRQFTIILFISLVGEIIHLLVPLPVPASIYGLLLMLIGLRKKWIPLEAVEEVSIFRQPSDFWIPGEFFGLF